MVLDLSSGGNLYFIVNNVDQGIAYKNIDRGNNIKYRMAVSYNNGNVVTLISYSKHINDTNDEFKMNDNMNHKEHQRKTTLECINDSIQASLQDLGVDINELNEMQKQKLIIFMDFTECEPTASVQYLHANNWEVQVAADQYLSNNPQHV